MNLFSGVQLYDDETGDRQVNIFVDGRILQAQPTDADRALPVGFYTARMEPTDPPEVPEIPPTAKELGAEDEVDGADDDDDDDLTDEELAEIEIEADAIIRAERGEASDE